MSLRTYDDLGGWLTYRNTATYMYVDQSCRSDRHHGIVSEYPSESLESQTTKEHGVECQIPISPASVL